MKKIIVLLAITAMCLVASTAASASNLYTCAYAKKIGGLGRVYIAIGVSPKYVGPSACRAFNSGFHGRRVPIGRLGNGHVYCKFGHVTKLVTIVAEVFADKRSAGKAFCIVFNPGHGWKRL